MNKINKIMISIISILIVINLFIVGCAEPSVSNLAQNGDLADKTTEDIRREEIEQNEIRTKNFSVEEKDLNGTAQEIKMSDKTQQKSEINLNIDIDYLNTQFESIYFDFDKFTIRENMLPKLNSNVKIITSKEAITKNIIIQGNCDEWGTDEYNYALGLKRAQVIKEALIAEGVNEDRLRIISYGESNPICLERKDECWAKNRRTDFNIEK
jgi:peptidoglycan-associated lipoprotein